MSQILQKFITSGRPFYLTTDSVRYLVALAVAGLDPGQVAVIDSRNGMVLAPGTDVAGADVSGEAADREAKLKAEIEQLLAARVGRDKARVSVTVETDREAESATEKTIKPDSRVTIHSETEEVSDQSSGSDGSVTVASNLPTGDAGGEAKRSSNRSETRERTNYDYSEVARQTTRQAGAIRRISVAVLVDGITEVQADGTTQWSPRPAEELKILRDLVVAAIGFDEARGDIVTVESLAFQPDPTPGTLVETNMWMRLLERNAMTLIQIGALALVALALGLTVVRPILTRPLPAPEPAWAAADGVEGEVLGDGALPAPDRAGLPAPEDDLANAPPDGETLKLVAAEKPDQTAAIPRDWLASAEEEPA